MTRDRNVELCECSRTGWEEKTHQCSGSMQGLGVRVGGGAHCCRFWCGSISKALGAPLHPPPFLIFSLGPLKITHSFGGTHKNHTVWAAWGITAAVGRSHAGFSQDHDFMAVPRSAGLEQQVGSAFCLLHFSHHASSSPRGLPLRSHWVLSLPSASYLVAYLGSFPCVLVG